jgi:hypothetical protein
MGSDKLGARQHSVWPVLNDSGRHIQRFTFSSMLATVDPFLHVVWLTHTLHVAIPLPLISIVARGSNETSGDIPCPASVAF